MRTARFPIARRPAFRTRPAVRTRPAGRGLGGTRPAVRTLPAGPGISAAARIRRRPGLVVGALVSGALALAALAVANTGSAGALAVAPSKVAFGSQEVGTESGPVVVTLYDDHYPARSLPSATASVTGDFRAEPPSCQLTSCTVAVVFAPSEAGRRTGALTVVDSAGVAHEVPLSGDGEGPPYRMVGVAAAVVGLGGLLLAGRQLTEHRHTSGRRG
jgi:hypothetical protein